MSQGMYDEMAKFHKNFYKKLFKENEEAFGKLYSSSGSNAELPQFPKHLEELAEQEIGSWCYKDPSGDAFKSWLVAKFKGFQPDCEGKLMNIKVVEKTLPVVLSVVLAILAKLYIDDSEQFGKFVDCSKLIAELAIVVLLFKLLKILTVVEFVFWKSLGILMNLEFAWICAGGDDDGDDDDDDDALTH